MSRIYIDNDQQEPVTQIAWQDRDGDTENIRTVTLDGPLFEVNSAGGGSATFFKQDIPKLIKALEKAMELGWHNA